MQQLELGLHCENSHGTVQRRAIQELQQLIASVNLLSKIAIGSIQQNYIQAVGLELRKVGYHSWRQIYLHNLSRRSSQMLKVETADFLRLAILQNGKVGGFKVWHRLALAVCGHYIHHHQTRVGAQDLIRVQSL